MLAPAKCLERASSMTICSFGPHVSLRSQVPLLSHVTGEEAEAVRGLAAPSRTVVRGSHSVRPGGLALEPTHLTTRLSCLWFPNCFYPKTLSSGEMGGDASIDEIKEEISTWECRNKDTQPP